MAGPMIRSSFPAILKTLRISLSFQPIISIQIGNGEQPSLVMTSFREKEEREKEREIEVMSRLCDIRSLSSKVQPFHDCMPSRSTFFLEEVGQT